MNKIISPLVAILLANGYAYSQADSLQQLINEHVWKPFIQSFNNLDTKGFMAVHSREMTRVIQDSNAIYEYDRYYKETEAGNETTRKSKRKQTLELRFTQRIATNDRAFEVGSYKFTSIQTDGTTRNGIWQVSCIA